MTIREALDKTLPTTSDGNYEVSPEYLVGIFENALRISYRQGQDDALATTLISIEARGVDAGALTVVGAITISNS